MKWLLGLILMGTLTSQARAICELETSYFIGAVVEVEGGHEVWINTRNHWSKYHSLTDSYSRMESQSLEFAFENVALCNLAESTYEYCGDKKLTKKDLILMLETKCIQVPKDFQSWAEEEIKL